MNQYLLLIHADAAAGEPTQEEWENFFSAANESGTFRGGSEIGSSEIIGGAESERLAGRIAGYMRFDAADKDQVLALLEEHPVVKHGGSVELCEMPIS